MTQAVPWFGFLLLMAVLLALDLGVFHRESRAIRAREALLWTAAWIGLSLAFSAVVYVAYDHRWMGLGDGGLSGREAMVQFITGYVVEKSLSLDNIFVIALVFRYFRVPLEHQHRVLFWGVLGALIARGVMIGAGVLLIRRFEWVTYVFGALLLITAVRLLEDEPESSNVEELWLVKWVRRVIPVKADPSTSSFFVRLPSGAWAATPQLLCLVMVESSDVMFAVDSIPAIFAFTQDPFIVYSSNILALMGLRSMYFAIADLLERFRYMKASLVFLLAFVGAKMLLEHHYPIPNTASLAIIVAILSVGIAASLWSDRPPKP